MTIPAYKFSDTNSPRLSLTKEDILKKFVRFWFGCDNLINQWVYKEMGWMYDCKWFLKKYWYKQHGYINEAYAPNKTVLREVIWWKIDTIVEIK